MADTTQSTTSSMTSTSHTLTIDPSFRATARLHHSAEQSKTFKAMDDLSKALEPSNRYTFIQPPTKICDAAIESLKNVLDRVASSVCDEQAARLKERKRKRGDGFGTEALRIRKVHTEGFAVEQVWEQARRVIDALRGEVVRELDELKPTEIEDEGKEEEHYETTNGLVKTIGFDEDGFELGIDDDSVEDEDVEELEDEDAEPGNDVEVDNEGLIDDGGGEDEDAFSGIDDVSDIEQEEDEYTGQAEVSGVFMEDTHGLNDGFFSIDEFNKQTEFLEQQDAAADPYTGEASDEEEIDWDADPISMTLPSVSNSKQAAAINVEDDDDDFEEDDDDSEGESGPTFGNADLDDSEGDFGEGEDDGTDGGANGLTDNTNSILYKDFFEPPPRKIAKGERQAKYLERQARKPKRQIPEDDEAEVERAIADVRRDLFDDNSEHEDSADALSDANPSEPKSRKSAHERRQTRLAEEIRRLESAAVAKRDWTLSGEARAADRPLNSLLEEDLDFERTGKPVPVITAEVSESIEELIKRRILAQEFDEVIRRRPDSDSVPASARRGMFELDDSKAQQSLAEIYEEDHVKATNPDTYMSQADEKLKKQHQEIESLWKDVSVKLDALSSWHYKPKPPAPSLTVVADVATVIMEDAQPTTASGVSGGASMLAPQEIYKAGQEKGAIEKGEVVPKSGMPVARQEMSREQKKRRRRREKERIRKSGGIVQKLPETRKAKEKKATVDDLKKGGVKVIGRRGDIKDIEGNKMKAAPVINGAGPYKL